MCFSEKLKANIINYVHKLTQIGHLLLLSQILDVTIICELLVSFNIWKVNAAGLFLILIANARISSDGLK